MVLNRVLFPLAAAAAFLPFAASAAQPLRLIQTITTEGPLNAVSWDVSGSRLAIMSGFGGKIKVRRIPSLEEDASFNPGLGGYAGNSLAFLNDATLLTPGHQPFSPETLLDWSLKPAREQRVFITPSDPKLHATANIYAVSKEGQLIATLTSDRHSSLEVFDGRSGALLWAAPRYDSDHFVAVAFAHSGAELAVATANGKILIMDPRSGSIMRTIQVHDPASNIRCSALAFSPDDRFILAGRAKNINLREDNLISADVLNSETGAHEAELPGLLVTVGSIHETSVVWSVDWNPSGDLVAVGDSASLRVWRVASDKPSLVNEEKAPGGVYSLQFSIRGVLAAGFSHEVRIYH